MGRALALTILTDNRVEGGADLHAEHGFSLLAATEEGRILFDTGATPLFLRNAASLGVDLTDVALVVLSHGHHDHSGGLPQALAELPRLRLLCHPDALGAKYERIAGADDRYIGAPRNVPDLREDSPRVQLVTETTEIAPDVLVTGPIPTVNDFESVESGFWMKDGAAWRPDLMRDEQALIVRTADGLVVVTGCAHTGVVNTLRHAIELTGERRVRAVVGGFHLMHATPELIARTSSALLEMQVAMVVACHCTGAAATAQLQADFGPRCLDGGVGCRITF
jgi:7,8-dihydropterin-6-yl-methyl-4-(beta-D-ribofuranosyl)aminobenzene 5'-phosphate synthase